MIDFDERTAIQHGTSSLFINLPRLFCKTAGIRKGSKVRVAWDQEQGTLIIKPKEDQK